MEPTKTPQRPFGSRLKHPASISAPGLLVLNDLGQVRQHVLGVLDDVLLFAQRLQLVDSVAMNRRSRADRLS